MVWFGHGPLTVMLLPATREGVAVPLPPLETGTRGNAEVARVPLVMLLAFVVSVVADGARPVTPLAGTDVAVMVPEPVGVKLAPEPISKVALVLVPPVRFVKVAAPPAEIAERAVRTYFSVGMLLSEPVEPTVVTTPRPADRAVPVVLLY